MFDTPIKEFFKVVKGDNGLSALLFYLVSGFLCGTLFFAVFNISGDLCVNCGIPIRVDFSKFFAFPIPLSEQNPSYPNAAKAIEYSIFVLVWIIFTFSAHILIRKLLVIDALTPIRKKISGEWTLQLDRFSDDGTNVTNFNCVVTFAETEIKKLRAFYDRSTHLQINGNTSMIAVAVSGDSPESSQIEISFPLISKIHHNNIAFLATYWITLSHVPRARGKNISFSGDWYKCMGPEDDFQKSGTASLVYRGAAQISP